MAILSLNKVTSKSLQGSFRLDFNLLCLITSVILVTINIVLLSEVNAQLQSFPRQEVTVGSRDGLQLNGTANTQQRLTIKVD
jgi:hypothetical protein